jgi:hypothetical protein
MDSYSRRFFDNSQVFILEYDLEWNLLSCHRLRFECPEIQLDGFSASNTVTGFVMAAVDVNAAGLIQALDLRTCQVVELLRKKNIQSESSILRSGLELHCG